MLSEAQAQQGPLDEKIRNERSTFDHHKEVWHWLLSMCLTRTIPASATWALTCGLVVSSLLECQSFELRFSFFVCFAGTQVVDEMHRKLGMAREQVDLAQARKEELWEKGALHLCMLYLCMAYFSHVVLVHFIFCAGSIPIG